MVSQRNETVQQCAVGVDGLRRQLDTDSLHSIYCAGKPVTAVAIGRLVDLGELSFDDRLGNLLDGLDASLNDLTIDELLTHRTGLWRYPAHLFMMMDAATRARAVRKLATDSTDHAVYAEFAGWELLGLVIEALSGDSFAGHVQTNLLEPLGLADQIFFDMPPEHHRRPDVRVNLSQSGHRRLPLLWEGSTESLRDACPATGAVASVAGLAMWYQQLLAELNGAARVIDSATLAFLVRPATESRHDPHLGRTCRFGRGFMAPLAEHGFGSAFSESSFGHSGLNGMTFAGADPERCVAFAVQLNTTTDFDPDSTDAIHSAVVRREQVGNALFVDLNLHD